MIDVVVVVVDVVVFVVVVVVENYSTQFNSFLQIAAVAVAVAVAVAAAATVMMDQSRIAVVLHARIFLCYFRKGMEWDSDLSVYLFRRDMI